MSKEQAKGLFQDGVTTWEEKTMKDYTDIVYDNLEKVSSELNDTIEEVGMVHRGYTSDANNATQIGTYRTNGATTNAPTTPSMIITFGASSAYKTQMCVHWNEGGVFIRTYWNGSWKNWRKINN